MWRRHSKDDLDVVATGIETSAAPLGEPDPVDPAFTPFEEWDGRWGSVDEERVARWLVDKVGPRSRSVLEHQVDRLSVAFQPERRTTASTFVLEDPWVSPARIPSTSSERDELASDVVHLREEREELSAGLAVLRMEVAAERERLEAELEEARAAAEQERRELSEGLAEARAAAEEERRRLGDLDALRASVDEERNGLLAALEAHRTEAEERHRQQAALVADRADIEAQRRRLAAERPEFAQLRHLREETARLAAELPALEERQRRAAESLTETEERLRAIQEQGAREEAARFEVWSALDAEIADLERRRGQF